MDELDNRLIELLRMDGRSSNIKMATHFGVSGDTVRRRVQVLLNDNVIRVAAIPDPAKLGFGTSALVGLQVDPGRVNSVSEQMTSLVEVHYVAETMGVYDIFIWVAVASLSELAKFLRDTIGSITGVTRTETFLNLDIKKNAYGPGSWAAMDAS
jgi:Lrp/AsnC family transcriptional regulator for asnA, asnC and gidA